MNDFGSGHALYIGADAEDRFLFDLFQALVRRLSLPRATGGRLPQGVGARIRSDGTRDFLFLLNFTNVRKHLRLAGAPWQNALTGKAQRARVSLGPFGFEVLQRNAAAPVIARSSG
jgi:beta-galactosidase